MKNNEKMMECIINENINDFNSLIRTEEFPIDTYFPVILNETFNGKNIQFVISAINLKPELSYFKNNQGYNIAHLIAIKDWQDGEELLNIIPNEVFFEKDAKGFRPFHIACIKSTGKLWNYFLSHETTDVLNKSDNMMNISPLHLATLSNSEEKVKNLLNANAHSNIDVKSYYAIMDIALDKKNWNILSLLIDKTGLIKPDIILKVAKDFNNSEKNIQSFIDNEKLKKEIFPLDNINKQPLWSYFFYYMPYSFLKKNKEFVKDYFQEDLKKSNELESIVYSIFSGKRDTLKKFNWWMSFNPWKKFSGETLSNVSSFNKELPDFYSIFFDKFSTEELTEIKNSKPAWLNKISSIDAHIINIIYLSKGLERLFENESSLDLSKEDRQKNKLEMKIISIDYHPTKILIKEIFNRINEDTAYSNFNYLNSLSEYFIIPSDILYSKFINEIKFVKSPEDYFQKLLQKKDNFNLKTFCNELCKNILYADSTKSGNHVLNVLRNNDIIKDSILLAIDNLDSTSNKKYKRIKNWDFNVDIDIYKNTFGLGKIFKVINSENYSPKSLLLLDKISNRSIHDFNINDVNDLWSELSSINNLSENIISRIDSLKNTLLKDSIYTAMFIMGQENLKHKIKSISCENMQEILSILPLSCLRDKKNIAQFLEICVNEKNILNTFWDKQKTEKIDPVIYLNVLSRLNYFDSFFEFMPINDEINIFEVFLSNKSENFENYLVSKAPNDFMKIKDNFLIKDALFIGTEVLMLNERCLSQDEKDFFKTSVNKICKDKNTLSIHFVLLSSVMSKMVERWLDCMKDKEFFSDILFNTSINNFCFEKWYKIAQATTLENLLDEKMCNVISDDIPLTNLMDRADHSFKI